MGVLPILFLAAALEIGGDAAIRHGLARSGWPWLMLGAAALVSYGFVVNANRLVDFGRLMGVYIAVFFVVSQLISFASFGEKPSASLVFGGGLIVAGGLVIELAR
jgi:small multidrug resistance family-3 protein